MVDKKAEVDAVDALPRKETWRDFLYDSHKGTVLGRTGISWLKIGIFYIVFYCFLAGWFTGLLHAFYSTLDDVKPTYYGANSLLQNNPALGIRPMPLFDTTLIRYTLGRRSSYLPYTDHLDAFLHTYRNSSASTMCTDAEPVTETDGCKFDVDHYLEQAGCKKEDDYGFKAGQPCIVVKMNKLFGFTPKPYATLKDIQDDLMEGERFRFYSYSDGNIGISCDGQNEVDAQHVKKIDFYPKNGLDMKFFPYMNQRGYRPPFVIAKFTNMTKELTVQINCKVWATDIDNSDGKEKRGSVHFEFFIN